MITAGNRLQTTSSDEAIIVEMTYVGIYTEMYLKAVQQGTQTLATLKRALRIWGNTPSDCTLSRHEAISLLERREQVEISPTELASDRASYQTAIQNIESEPYAYVAPELARKWYE